MLTIIANVIGSRFGMAGVVAALMSLAIGALWLDRASLKADVAGREAQIATLRTEIEAQNAAAEKIRADALAASQSAADRARVALKPRPKPQTATVGALNDWLIHP